MIDPEEIKRYNRIEDVVSRYVKLNGGVGLCPFHNEKTPSFHVDVKKQIFKCFGCGEGGDVIKFWMKYFNIDFLQACNELLPSNNIPPHTGTSEAAHRIHPSSPGGMGTVSSVDDIVDSMSEGEKEMFEERAAIADEDTALKEIRKYRIEQNREVFEEMYYYCIKKGCDSASSDYLVSERRLKPDLLDTFKIFSIGNYNELNNHLKKCFNLERLQRSGLYNDKGNLIFYQHRIIIPYLHNNRIVYMRGRTQGTPPLYERGGREGFVSKYLGLRSDGLGVNTPKRFFNIDILRQMLPGEKLYICEGEFDAMALTQLGRNAIAIPGAGNIPARKQFKKLWDFEIVLCGDSDDAGSKMQDELIKIFTELEKEISRIKLPAKDINQFLIECEAA